MITNNSLRNNRALQSSTIDTASTSIPPPINLLTIYKTFNQIINSVMSSFLTSSIFYHNIFQNFGITISNLTDVALNLISQNQTNNHHLECQNVIVTSLWAMV